MTKKKGAKNPLDIKDLKEIQYKIECYVETVSSDGCVTVRGVDGYRLEKGKTYNVIWKLDAEEVKIFPVGESLSLGENSKDLQFLLTAKANHLKVSLDVALDGAKGKDKVLIQKIALI